MSSINILVHRGGMVARPWVECLLRDKKNNNTVGKRHLSEAREVQIRLILFQLTELVEPYELLKHSSLICPAPKPLPSMFPHPQSLNFKLRLLTLLSPLFLTSTMRRSLRLR